MVQNRANYAYNTQNQNRGPYSNERMERRTSERDCFYCEESGHFSRECPYKEDHINKGQLVVENGRHKLGDGSFIPTGPGSQRQRVDNYWKAKAASQNWNSAVDNFYNSESEGGINFDAETAMDEIRTLKVKLARAQQVNSQNSIPQVVQPTYIAQSQQLAPATPIATTQPGIDLNHTLQTLLMRGLAATANDVPATQEQFATTRLQTKTSQGQNF